ncbi:hypothetical protein ACLKA7_000468 [Drosophila subpalustris]
MQFAVVFFFCSLKKSEVGQFSQLETLPQAASIIASVFAHWQPVAQWATLSTKRRMWPTPLLAMALMAKSIANSIIKSMSATKQQQQQQQQLRLIPKKTLQCR